MTAYANSVVRGAASELIVSAHLMAQGYHVFRALAASCPFDLVAYRNNEAPIRVEVKTAGRAAMPTYNVGFPRPANDEWDVLAVVDYAGRVVLLERQETLEQMRDAYFAAVGAVRKIPGKATHCKYGHEWTPENTLRTSAGARSCRTCREADKVRRAEKRSA